MICKISLKSLSLPKQLKSVQKGTADSQKISDKCVASQNHGSVAKIMQNTAQASNVAEAAKKPSQKLTADSQRHISVFNLTEYRICQKGLFSH